MYAGPKRFGNTSWIARSFLGNTERETVLSICQQSARNVGRNHAISHFQYGERHIEGGSRREKEKEGEKKGGTNQPPKGQKGQCLLGISTSDTTLDMTTLVPFMLTLSEIYSHSYFGINITKGRKKSSHQSWTAEAKWRNRTTTHSSF